MGGKKDQIVCRIDSSGLSFRSVLTFIVSLSMWCTSFSHTIVLFRCCPAKWNFDYTFFWNAWKRLQPGVYVMHGVFSLFQVKCKFTKLSLSHIILPYLNKRMVTSCLFKWKQRIKFRKHWKIKGRHGYSDMFV